MVLESKNPTNFILTYHIFPLTSKFNEYYFSNKQYSSRYDPHPFSLSNATSCDQFFTKRTIIKLINKCLGIMHEHDYYYYYYVK